MRKVFQSILFRKKANVALGREGRALLSKILEAQAFGLMLMQAAVPEEDGV